MTKTRAALLAATLISGAAHAQESTGVPECDAMLKAYSSCAASPGLPQGVAPGLTQAIEGMRTNFRTTAAGSAAAHRTIGAQCLQMHGIMSKQLTESLKCDFPGPATTTAAAAAASPGTPAPAPTQDMSERQAITKVNAYTEVQNSLASRSLASQLADHRRINERVLKLGTKLGANAYYQFSINDFDRIIERLEKAMSLPGAIPEVDPAAEHLLAALQAVNPTVKTLERYQKTREFKVDEYKLAREQEPILVSGMSAAADAASDFSTALFNRSLARDEARLATLTPATLPHQLLTTSLATRRLMQRYKALGTPDSVQPFQDAITPVIAANKDLADTIATLKDKVDSDCTSYSEDIDSMIGRARDLAGDLLSRSNPKQSSEGFIRYYNNAVDHMTSCRRDEARAGR